MVAWIVTVIALTGAFLNIKKRWEGFALWMISNGFWCLVNIGIEQYPQAVLFAVFFLLSAYGVVLWRKPQKPSQGIINLCKQIIELKETLKTTERRKVNWLFEEAKKILEGGNGEVEHRCK